MMTPNKLFNTDVTVSGVVTTVSGSFEQSLTVSGLPVQLEGGGSGSLTDINTTATGPSVTITGVGGIQTITDGNVITLSGSAPGDFLGAVIYKAAAAGDQTVNDGSTDAITFGTSQYDLGDWAVDPVNPDRLTVPSGLGIRWVNIKAQVQHGLPVTTDAIRLEVSKNGQSGVIGPATPLLRQGSTESTVAYVQIVSYPVDVIPGDWFRINFTNNTGGAVDVKDDFDNTWFAITAVQAGGNSQDIVVQSGTFSESLTISGVPVSTGTGGGASTLQEAYDGGDGTIAITDGKPFELTASGGLVAVTGTFTEGLTVGTATTFIGPDGISTDSLTVDGVPVTGGAGTLTDINTTATGPSVTITGVGSTRTITDGNVVTISGLSQVGNSRYDALIPPDEPSAFDDEFDLPSGSSPNSDVWTTFDPGSDLNSMQILQDPSRLFISTLNNGEFVGITRTDIDDSASFALYTYVRPHFRSSRFTGFDNFHGIVLVQDIDAPTTSNLLLCGVFIEKAGDGDNVACAGRVGAWEFAQYNTTPAVLEQADASYTDFSTGGVFIKVSYNVGLNRVGVFWSNDGVAWQMTALPDLDTTTVMTGFNAIGIMSRTDGETGNSGSFGFFRTNNSGESTTSAMPAGFLAGAIEDPNFTEMTAISGTFSESLTISGVPVSTGTGGGTSDHAALDNLDFASSGHTGFASEAELLTVSGNLQTQIDTKGTASTLQEAYTDGDGTISTTGGKPLELTGTGELTAVTGTFTDGLTVGSSSTFIDGGSVTTATGTFDEVTVDGVALSTTLVPGFRGAYVVLTTGIAVPTFSNGIFLHYDQTTYDTDGFFDSGEGEKLTIPAGVNKVQAFAGVRWDDDTPDADGTSRLISITQQNSSDTTIRRFTSWTIPGVATSAPEKTGQITTTPTFDVSEGDNLKVFVRQNSGGNLNVEPTPDFSIWFSIEVKDPVATTPNDISAISGTFSQELTVSGIPVRIDGDGLDVDAITVSGGPPIQGTVDFVGANGVNVSDSGNTITIDGQGIVAGGGAGTLTDINTTATGPSVTITGVGGINTITEGNTITVSGGQFSPGFMGARVSTSSGISSTDGQAIVHPWDEVVYDTNGFFSISDETAFTIPGGVNRIILKGMVQWPSSTGFRRLQFRQGAGTGSLIQSFAIDSAPGTSHAAMIESPTLNVVEGDRFVMSINQNSGGSLTTTAVNPDTRYFFELQVVDPLPAPGPNLTGKTAFRGAFVQTSSGVDFATGIFQQMIWDTTNYDTEGFFDAADPGVFTIPAGVTRVRLESAIVWEATAGAGERLVRIESKTAGNIALVADQSIGVANASRSHATPLVSPIINVQEGEQYQVRARQESAANLDIVLGAESHFSIEVIEDNEPITFNNFVAASGIFTDSLTISGVPVSTGTPSLTAAMLTTGNQFLTDNAVHTVLDWNSEVYDRGGWHTNTSGPTISGHRLTVPPDVSFASFQYQIQVTASGTPASTAILNTQLLKNGEILFPMSVGTTGPVSLGASNGTIVDAESPALPVTAGDYFEVRVRIVSYTVNAGTNGTRCFFSAKKEA